MYRVFSIPTSISSAAQSLLAGQAYAVVTDVDELARPADDATVDVIHVPRGDALDPARARQMLARSSAARFGILSDDAGLVLHRPDRDALQHFYRPFVGQADESVYMAGAHSRRDVPDGALVPAPRQVYLGLTQRCNRSCSFCVSRTFEFDRLSISQIDELCEQLAGEVDVVALTGAGEAMTHPEFWEIMDRLCDRLPGVQFKMNTSGVALTRKASRLLTYPVRNITVSLNAASQPTYEQFVGRGFHAVLDGIAALVHARAEMRRTDLSLCLSMVLMNSTVGEVAQLATIAAELGVEEIQGIYLMINDDDLAHESPWHQPERSNELLSAASRHAAALGVRASLPPPFNQAGMSISRDQVASLPTTHGQRCTEAWSTIYVRPNGEVMACPYMDRAMGDIRRQSVTDVWNGPEYASLRQGLRSSESWPECRHCSGFNEQGTVDEYWSHWLGVRRPVRTLPLVAIQRSSP